MHEWLDEGGVQRQEAVVAQEHDLGKHLVNVMKQLLSEYEQTKAYQHRGGVGDAREQIIRDWLRSFLPRGLNVRKGEIVDHSGKRSVEFDIVIHLDSTAPQLFGTPDRAVIPVEEVLAVIEVKTHLTRAAMTEFSDNMSSLGPLERCFVPSAQTAVISGLLGASTEAPGPLVVPTFCSHMTAIGIGPVMGMLFAFEGPSDEVIASYMSDYDYWRWFDFVFVLGRGFWAIHHPEMRFSGEHAALLMAQRMLESVDDRERWASVRVDVERYMKSMFNQAIENIRRKTPV